MKILVNLIGTLIGLMLIALLTLLLLAPEAAITFLGRLSEVDFPLRVGLVVIIFLVSLVIFSIRLRLTPRGKSDALTVRTSDTVSSVTVESVRELVLKTVRAVPGVSTVDANVNSIGGRADIHLNVTTSDDRLNIPEKQREIGRVLDQVIKKQLGLQMLGRPKINIQLGTKPPQPLAPPVMSEPVRPAPPPPTYREPETPARAVPTPVASSPAPPPAALPVVAAAPPVIVPPPDEVVETQTETQDEGRGFFGRFGIGESKRDEEADSVVERQEDTNEEDAGFYAMLEADRVKEEPNSTIVIDEPITRDEDQDKDQRF